MGFLDNSSTTVDAILTKAGRELLAKGEGAFKITRFRLSDDEVDYSLYDTTHPNGSNFYGAVIENISLLEAFPSGHVKYFLVSQATDSTKVGIINVDTGTVNLRGGQRFKLDPTTDNVADSSYTFILSDSKVASRFRGYGAGSSFSSSGGTSTARGTGLFMVASRTLLQKTSATITITGTDSGATATIPVTVAKGT